jgi:site-specific recombinase XerD
MSVLDKTLDISSHIVDTNRPSGFIREAIAKYQPETPSRLWNDAVQEFTRSAVTDFAPYNVVEAGKNMSAVAHLALWTTHVACHSLKRDVVFDDQNIDAYISSATKDKSADRRRLLRLRLLRIASELHDFDPARRERRRNLGRNTTGGYAPHSAAEIIRFRNQGATRSTAHRRHNWIVLLSLAAGCALRPAEIVYLRTDDIELADNHVAVHVKGERARTVICRAEWEDDIRAFMNNPAIGKFPLIIDYVGKHAGQGDPLTGRPVTPSAFIETLVKKAADDTDARFSVERLRTTWIVAHLEEGTDLLALLRAIGDKSFSALTRVARYAHEPEADELITMFRGEGTR